MKTILSSLLLFAFNISLLKASDQLFNEANKAYADKEFKTAIELYEDILSTGKTSPDLLYNLGNSYFKSGKIPEAILFYEKALKLKPDDDDIKHNLSLAYTQTTDKIEIVQEVSFGKWVNDVAAIYNETQWSILAIILFSLMCVGIYFFAAGRNTGIRQIGFGASLLFLICFFITIGFANNRFKTSTTPTHAIVFDQILTVKSSPNEEGTNLFIIHEGTKVKLEKELDGWTEIKLSNGDVGWVQNKSIRSI